MSALHKLYTTVRGTLLVLPFAIHLIGADALISLLLPLSPLFPGLVYSLSSRLALPVWTHIQNIFTVINGATIVVGSSSSASASSAAIRSSSASESKVDDGKDETKLSPASSSISSLPIGESAIVIANHVAWTDFYMIQALAQRAQMLGSCRWFAKRELRWVPLLGWGLWAMGFPLISRNWTSDQAEMERVFGGIRRNLWPVWLIAYSESTRFSPAKHAEAVRWSEEHGRRPPVHTLVPRYRGFVATVKQLRQTPHVKAVYDLTIAYASKVEEQRSIHDTPVSGSGGVEIPRSSKKKEWTWKFMAAPSMWDSLSDPAMGKRCKFYVHAERFELKDLPASDEDLRAWLEERWVVKDQRLEALRVELAKKGTWE